MNPTIIDNIALNIDPRRILVRFGYGRNAIVPQSDLDLVNDLLPQMLALTDPRIAIADFKISNVTADYIELDNGVKITSSMLAEILANAKFVSLYVATIGAGVETKSTRLSDMGKVKESLLWDCFGSEAAETVARRVSVIVHQRAKAKGLTNTLRFSPGYMDLSLDFNKKIVDLVGGKKIGVSVNSAGLLIPRKSTTGIVGWVVPKKKTQFL